MTVQALYAVEHADTGGYEPFIHQGAQVGEIRAIRAGTDGTLEAGIWRSGRATYDYFFADDEAFVVLEGAASIELPETKETVEVAAGDVAYFVAGTRSVWTITQPFKKFVVVPA
jgi:uncharacterized cupin superfamily protein